MNLTSNIAWSWTEFLEELKEIGQKQYHDKHPFHIRMHEGKLSKNDLQLWIKNRFYYQKNIPIKDAFILTKLPSSTERRIWIKRIIAHDGEINNLDNQGGIEAWLYLGEAAGLERNYMLDDSKIIPSVRFAVDAYINFCRLQPWYLTVASSLTELFAPDLISNRMSAISKHYPFIDDNGLKYFRTRVNQANNESIEALSLLKPIAINKEIQLAIIEALSFKCNVLWSLLDAIDLECNKKQIYANN